MPAQMPPTLEIMSDPSTSETFATIRSMPLLMPSGRTPRTFTRNGCGVVPCATVQPTPRMPRVTEWVGTAVGHVLAADGASCVAEPPATPAAAGTDVIA